MQDGAEENKRTNLPRLHPLHPLPNLVHMHAFLASFAQDLGDVRGFHKAEAGGEVILFNFVQEGGSEVKEKES